MRTLSFFHNVMSSRRRKNAIQFILVDGVLVEGVANVRSAVFSHFSTHFQPRRVNRPSMENLHFRSLSCRQGSSLIKPFFDG
jgi:hypothetical protein